MSISKDKRPIREALIEKGVESLLLAVIGLFFAPFIVLAAQILLYLKDGTWPNWVLFDLIYPAIPARLMQWLTAPQDWYGMHKIVAWVLLEVPIAFDTLALSVVCIWSVVKFSET